MAEVSVVVPCFNEEAGLEECVNRIARVRLAMYPSETQAARDSLELILVDDGSSDSTWQIIESCCDRFAWVKGLKLSRNFGHQAALIAGIKETTGQYILIIDADLQDPPELLPEMLEEMKRGYDVVSGVRRSRQGEGLFKKMSAQIYYRMLSRASGRKLSPENVGDFRLISRKVADELSNFPEKNKYLRGIFDQIGFPQKTLAYDRQARFAGKTNYPMKKMMAFSIDGIFGFSGNLLRFLPMLSLVGFLACIVILIAIVIIFLQGKPITGWSSLAFGIVFFQSINFLFYGIIGEYIYRVYDQVRDRPEYIIEKKRTRNMTHAEN